MTLAIAADLAPLAADESGVIRVGGTRVTLDSIVESFQQGSRRMTLHDNFHR